MHVGVAMEGGVEAVSAGVGPQPRHRGPRRFLHGLAQESGQGQRPGAGHPARFDRRHGSAAARCDAQPEDGARTPGAASELGIRHRRAEHIDDGLRRDLDPGGVSLGTTAHHLGAQVAERRRQTPHPGFSRVAADHRPDRLVGDVEVINSQSVAPEL